ncbi:MAG: molybdopterin-dependent oxidoreductase [Armatimonadota bacterium]|nr:molybdopterin-dependent oxidoreductase [Armatimonadota bacterium]MDR7549808.1 molybdopterin-dependent oxidoreductase [Armatimonadota bacterium]
MRQHVARRGVVAGAVAGVALVLALTAGALPAGMVLAASVAERARALLPLQVLGYLIVRLKFAAKPFGFWTSMAGVVLFCAIAGGVLASWRPRRHVVAGLAMAVVVGGALAAVAGRPALVYLSASLGAEGVADADGAAVRIVLASTAAAAAFAGAVFALVLFLLGRRTDHPASHPGADASGASSSGSARMRRREVLARTVVMAATAAGAGGFLQWAGTKAAVAAAVRSAFDRVRGLPPDVTPNDKFYVVSKNPFGLDPRLDAKKWTLEIAGLVGKPVRLTYDQIRALPSVARYHTLECISNEVGGDLIGNAMWKGVRFRDVIQLAGGVSPRAVRFALRCADGYSEGIPVADAMQPDVMLAYEMNGEPLPPAHGFPVRLLIPGLFGMKNPKWLTKIEAVSTHFTGYWQASGWSDEAVVKTTSQFRVPTDRGQVALGEVGLGGIAYSGDRGIQEVEFSTDGGKTWSRAEVKKALGPYTWVLWAAVWTPSGPGEYTLKVRAKDGTGVIQSSQETPTLPDGASGYHTIRIRVRK